VSSFGQTGRPKVICQISQPALPTTMFSSRIRLRILDTIRSLQSVQINRVLASTVPSYFLTFQLIGFYDYAKGLVAIFPESFRVDQGSFANGFRSATKLHDFFIVYLSRTPETWRHSAVCDRRKSFPKRRLTPCHHQSRPANIFRLKQTGSDAAIGLVFSRIIAHFL
jgi:hypothetical protein